MVLTYKIFSLQSTSRTCFNQY